MVFWFLDSISSTNQKNSRKTKENQKNLEKTKNQSSLPKPAKFLFFWFLVFSRFFGFSLVSSSFFFLVCGVLVSLFEEEVPLDSVQQRTRFFSQSSLQCQKPLANRADHSTAGAGVATFCGFPPVPEYGQKAHCWFEPCENQSSLLQCTNVCGQVQAASLNNPSSLTPGSFVTASSLPHHFLVTSSSLPRHFLVTSSYHFCITSSLLHHFRITSSSLPHHFFITSSLLHHFLITSSSLPHHFLITSSSLLHYFVTASSLPHHFLITSSLHRHYFITSSSLPHHFLITSSSPPHHFFIASSLLHHCSLMTCSLLAQNMVDMSSHFLSISSSRCIWCYLWHLVDADTDLR